MKNIMNPSNLLSDHAFLADAVAGPIPREAFFTSICALYHRDVSMSSYGVRFELFLTE